MGEHQHLEWIILIFNQEWFFDTCLVRDLEVIVDVFCDEQDAVGEAWGCASFIHILTMNVGQS